MKKIILISCFFILFTTATFAQNNEEVGRVLDQIEQMGQVYNIDEENTQEETNQYSQEMEKISSEMTEMNEVDNFDSQPIKTPEVQYTFEIGPEFYSFHYDEPTIDVEEEAFLSGVQAAVTGRSKSNALMGRVEGRFVAGRVDYDGSLSDGTPWTDKGDDFAFEFRGLVGRDFKMGESRITPIFGVGYRYLNDNLESQYAYEREIRYTYSPIGFEVLSPIVGGWSLGVHAEYDIFWQGIVKSHLSDVNPSYSNVRNEQDSGFGARASVCLNKKIGEKLSLSIEPFIRYWDIDRSNIAQITYSGYIIGYGYEPRNRTEEYGLKISLAW